MIGWELLDVIPGPILERAPDGRLFEVLVDPATGREALGAEAGPDERAWSEQWWPPPPEGMDSNGFDEPDGQRGR